jgi:hypothetical protein
MSTPELQLRTLFVLNAAGRILSTREPGGEKGPLLFLARSGASCAWAIRADVPEPVAQRLEVVARREPPAADLHAPPVGAQQLVALLGDRLDASCNRSAKSRGSDGPAFVFPDAMIVPEGNDDIVRIEDEALVARHFRGWVPGEIAAGRAPVLGVMRDGHAVSICYSARLSDEAAEAGLDTAPGFRGRGLGPRVAAAWARAIRASGRVALYSTFWSNAASLAVAKKLGLEAYASEWSLHG